MRAFRYWAWPLALMGLAFGLRVHELDTHGLYLDEKYTMVISQGVVMDGANQKDVFFTPGKRYFTPREFWKPKTMADFMEANIRGDIGNSPAYYAVLWAWLKAFGLNDYTARLLSVVFSTLTVGLVYVFVRQHLGSQRLAVLSAFLAAIEPFFIAYSHMARNYSMSFFLTLLATHLLLVYGQRRAAGQAATGTVVAYGAVLAAALLSHYLAATVLLCHGLYVLVFVRPPHRWVPLLAGAAGAVAVAALWLIWGGGRYTLQTLAYQAQLYKHVALTNPHNSEFGEVLPATLQNVAVKALPLWSDLLLFSNGLGQISTLGIRNLGIALLLGLGALGVFLFSRKKTGNLAGGLVFAGLLVAGLPLFTVPNPQLVVATAVPTLLYLLAEGLRRFTTPTNGPVVGLLLLLAVLPTAFLLLMSVRNGHTYGITQRYSGFSFPYTIVLVALTLQQVMRQPLAFRWPLAAVLAVQAVLVAGLLQNIYADRSPKYTYFVNPRQPNPHYAAAQRIRALYAPGDTVLYPAIRLHFRDAIEKTHWPYSIKDAQLTNLYLPHDAGYLQRMDTLETGRIILVRAHSGRRVVLADLSGHRY